MAADLIGKLENESVGLMEACLREIRGSGSPQITAVPEEELRVALYMFVLKVLDFLRSESAVSAVARIDATDYRTVFLRAMMDVIEAVEQANKTPDHCKKTAQHCGLIGARLKMSDGEVEEIEYAALIHNIGLINTSHQLLSKPSKLSADELAQARNHCVVGAEILRPIGFLSNIVPMVRYHHARWDGTGIPPGIGGDSIPLGARVIALCDAYQAMISPRPHRPPLSRDEAILELDKNSGKQFDPKLVPLAHELA